MREDVSVEVAFRRNGVYRDLCGIDPGMTDVVYSELRNSTLLGSITSF